jgi:uncharacterized surface protein with fasciclin (FAS1) repeats
VSISDPSNNRRLVHYHTIEAEEILANLLCYLKATVALADVLAKNGVVHVIDAGLSNRK